SSPIPLSRAAAPGSRNQVLAERGMRRRICGIGGGVQVRRIQSLAIWAGAAHWIRRLHRGCRAEKATRLARRDLSAGRAGHAADRRLRLLVLRHGAGSDASGAGHGLLELCEDAVLTGTPLGYAAALRAQHPLHL